jgi:hypothetical protein
MLGLQYKWGGDDPLDGVDCSGLGIEGLKACGEFPREGDATALILATMFPETKEPKPGCLIFWGNPINHVEIVYKVEDDKVYTIGASGGGSKTLTVEDAIKHNAYVKIRPARPNHVKMVDPFRR